MRRIRIEVPGTASGLGPGIGALGLALEVAAVVHAEIDEEGTGVKSEEPCLADAYRAWPAGHLPGVSFSVERHLPRRKGLGDDVALLLAGLAAAAYATGSKHARPALLRQAVDLSQDAARAAAALGGGMTAAFRDGAEVRALHVANHLALDVALFMPEDASHLAPCPRDVPFDTAVAGLGRLAYLTAMVICGRWDRMGEAMHDVLFDPPPQAASVLAAAREAGAYGAALSAPSIVALAPREAGPRIAAAMETRAQAIAWAGTSIVTGVREMGIEIRAEKSEGER